MKSIYIAGPYSATDIMDILRNIRKGQEVAALLIRMGNAVYCPFLDWQLVMNVIGSNLSKQELQANSMYWATKCDAVYVLPGWENSEGSKKEIRMAKSLKIPVFYDMGDLHEWLLMNKSKDMTIGARASRTPFST